jgi:hypothetical protein
MFNLNSRQGSNVSHHSVRIGGEVGRRIGMQMVPFCRFSRWRSFTVGSASARGPKAGLAFSAAQRKEGSDHGEDRLPINRYRGFVDPYDARTYISSKFRTSPSPL